MSEQEEIEETITEQQETEEVETEHTKKVKKLDIPQTIDYINNQEMHVLEWENYSKKKCIFLLAEKYENAGFPILEIRSEILKLVHGLNPQYLSKCLPDRFKNPNKIATRAGKSSNTPKTEVIVEHHSDGGDAEYEEPITPIIETPEKLEPQNIIETDETYIRELQNEIRDLKEQIKLYDPKTPYHEKQDHIVVTKLDKIRVTMLQNANTSALKEVHMFIDKRTGETVKIISDREFKKQEKNA